MDDDFEPDPELLQALASVDASQPARPSQHSSTQAPPSSLSQPPRSVPSTSRNATLGPLASSLRPIDKANASTTATATSTATYPVQPTPQTLPAKPSLGSTILVSRRQQGNPVLQHLRSFPWEFSDTPADYVMGVTTCALFLSLKYHRLYPEYIYNRIKQLQGRYQLRIILTLVDITNHEDPIRELTKTSLIQNVTVILCWSAAEAARYLELYKSYEHASFDAIRGHQAANHVERLIDFVTVPRSVNRSDALALVSNFGSLRKAINASPEEIGLIGGWGGVKVRKWSAAVEEPFRLHKKSKTSHPPDPESTSTSTSLSTVTSTATESYRNPPVAKPREAPKPGQNTITDALAFASHVTKSQEAKTPAISTKESTTESSS